MRGRHTATLATDLAQPEGLRITALADDGHLGGLPDEVGTTAAEPVPPPREKCVCSASVPADLRAIAPILDRFQMLPDPASTGWTVGDPSEHGLIQGWFRMNDGREPTAL